MALVNQQRPWSVGDPSGLPPPLARPSPCCASRTHRYSSSHQLPRCSHHTTRTASQRATDNTPARSFCRNDKGQPCVHKVLSQSANTHKQLPDCFSFFF